MKRSPFPRLGKRGLAWENTRRQLKKHHHEVEYGLNHEQMFERVTEIIMAAGRPVAFTEWEDRPR